MTYPKHMTISQIKDELARLKADGFINEDGLGVKEAGVRVASLRIALHEKMGLGGLGTVDYGWDIP